VRAVSLRRRGRTVTKRNDKGMPRRVVGSLQLRVTQPEGRSAPRKVFRKRPRPLRTGSPVFRQQPRNSEVFRPSQYARPSRRILPHPDSCLLSLTTLKWHFLQPQGVSCMIPSTPVPQVELRRLTIMSLFITHALVSRRRGGGGGTVNNTVP
jgi:hypothetical protein